MTSGRIPARVEKAIRKLLMTYSSNITSVLSQFPSQQVRESILSNKIIIRALHAFCHFIMLNIFMYYTPPLSLKTNSLLHILLPLNHHVACVSVLTE